MKRVSLTTAVVAMFALGFLMRLELAAQFAGPTLPPSGDNQKASVSQWIGLVEVNITYNSPDVTGPNGEDRTGKIWGQLVPYGMATLGFGNCGENCPWRAGANENTVFTVSHDVEVEGQRLAAGSYGLHMIPGEEEWTVIFSRNHESWGSFFYDESEDALRIQVEPQAHEFNHWLTYEFIERQPSQATVAMRWESLQVAWKVAVPDITDLYVQALRNDLRSSAGFTWMGFNAAALYCLGEKTNLEEALGWAEAAVSLPFIGQENFNTLTTLAQLQDANGRVEEGKATLERAIRHATASPPMVHQLGRTMITQGEPQRAMEIFELNAELHPDVWPVNLGMARGLSALGRFDEAIAFAEAALENAPDDLNRGNIENLLELLRQGKDIN